MKIVITYLAALTFAAFLFGCNRQAEPEPTGPKPTGQDRAAEAPLTQTTHAADTEQILQVGCAGCIYEQDWAKGCQTAVKVGDQVLLVKGVDFNAHKKGLCKAEKTARITGHAEADHFAATQIEIQP